MERQLSRVDGWPSQLSKTSETEKVRLAFGLPQARGYRTFEVFRGLLQPHTPVPLGRLWLPSPEVRLGRAAGQAMRGLLLGVRDGVPIL